MNALTIDEFSKWLEEKSEENRKEALKIMKDSRRSVEDALDNVANMSKLEGGQEMLNEVAKKVTELFIAEKREEEKAVKN